MAGRWLVMLMLASGCSLAGGAIAGLSRRAKSVTGSFVPFLPVASPMRVHCGRKR